LELHELAVNYDYNNILFDVDHGNTVKFYYAMGNVAVHYYDDIGVHNYSHGERNRSTILPGIICDWG
jgi:hypothetical protein